MRVLLLPLAPFQRRALARGARVAFRAHHVEAELWAQRAASRLADQILRCPGSAALVRALGAAGHRLAAERFPRPALATGLTDLYASLAGAGHAP